MPENIVEQENFKLAVAGMIGNIDEQELDDMMPYVLEEAKEIAKANGASNFTYNFEDSFSKDAFLRAY